MRFFSLFTLFLLLNAHFFAAESDSLLQRASGEKNDSIRYELKLSALVSLREEGKHAEFEKLYAELFTYFSGTDHIGTGILYREKGLLKQARSDYDSSRYYFALALEKFRQSGSPLYIADGHYLVGAGHRFTGNYEKAIADFLKGLSYIEGIDTTSIGKKRTKYYATYFNLLAELAATYIDQQDFEQALKMLKQCNQVTARSGDPFMLAKVYTATGAVYYYKNMFNDAIEQFKKALEQYQSMGHLGGMSESYNNIGLIYAEKKDFSNAIYWVSKSVEISNQMNDLLGVAQSFFNLGEIYKAIPDFAKADEYYSKSLEISRRILNKNQEMVSYKALAELYGANRQFEKAFQFMKNYSSLRDTILNEERNKAVADMQTKYDTEKKEQENNILKEQAKNQELINSRQRLILFGVSGLALLLFALAFFIYRNYKEKKAANVLLNEKNMVIEEKSRIVEEQNKDIKDSIRYAKRLQEAILPPVRKLNESFPDSFIFFRPKDIVSGDFYWFEKFGDQVFFAAADCTGHGVPGAFMSIMGSNLLNQAINEYALTKTNAILNSVNKGLAKLLRTQGEERTNVKDGMDIALCSINMRTLRLEYSGAYNPAWIIRENELIELKPDKFPVGENAYGEVKMFELRQFDLKKGDRIYVFSDGYADQFGGPKGKKFKYRTMQEMLIACKEISMDEQKRILTTTIDDWRGNLEQVDDILVMGIRI